MANGSGTDARIENKYRFPWYMPWKVNDLVIQSASPSPVDVTWECIDSEFIVIFPKNDNPFAGSNEVPSHSHKASAQVDVTKVKAMKKKSIHYAIILTDAGKEDVVEGANSPPTMIIE